MPTYERLDYGNDDGSQWGSDALSRLGMYGVTPVAQYTLVGAASTYDVASTSGNTGSTFGFSTLAAFTSMVYQVSTMTRALRNLGIIA